MKKTLLLIMLLSIESIIAQVPSKVDDYPLNAMDLVLFTFGMETPLSIGTISASGVLDFKFPENLNFIADDVKANFMSDAAFTLFSKCNNSVDILSKDKNTKAINTGNISLSSKENPYAGLLIMVSDTIIVPWLESNGTANAVLGSYFELVYVASDLNYDGECTSTVTYIENDPFETSYTYKLELKAGFNFIEYKIDSVKEQKVPSMYQEGLFDDVVKPSAITVTSSQVVPPTLIWIGKYF
ncbi:hypothetical protein MWU65_07525 [Cellulophaga sp. F20128]|uniref:hypothetical protein n=1 Tax=Cellulophaga sp. F20128 TaxID=2926413 RepID=UPI001FF674CF|nr:hypothetical protein [Cellulophaga sp. F20128]MCK0157026.1 hypothetical protein [Cellulophaga sp. F20128]